MTKDLGKLWAERMTRSERDTSFPDSEPRDAATLMLIDRSGSTPRVLLGRRHAGHKFMPGKFVFPGGRIEALDQQMTAVSELHPDAQKKLLERVEKPSTEFARAFALAAVRETAEETVDQLRESATEYYDRGRERISDLEKTLEERIREKPLQSMLMAAGAGVLLGIIWMRR